MYARIMVNLVELLDRVQGIDHLIAKEPVYIRKKGRNQWRLYPRRHGPKQYQAVYYEAMGWMVDSLDIGRGKVKSWSSSLSVFPSEKSVDSFITLIGRIVLLTRL